MNFLIQNSPTSLFSNLKADRLFIPLNYLKRQVVLSQSQADDIFNDYYMALKLEKAGPILAISFGIVIIVITSVMIYNRKKKERKEQFGEEDNEYVDPNTFLTRIN